MKSEPHTFSIDDLKKNKTTEWEGVRNYQARNFMKDDMTVGDQVLFYHSSCEVPGVVGLAVVSRKARPDKTQFDKKSEYYFPKATLEKPSWFCVEIKFQKKFSQTITLEELKTDKSLKDLLVIKRGQRLSIQPVSEKDFNYILQNLTK